MAEELYVENTGYPYLTSCSGDFYILYADFPNVCKRKTIKRIGEEKMFKLFENLTNWLWDCPADHDPRYRRISDSTFRFLPVPPFWLHCEKHVQ